MPTRHLLYLDANALHSFRWQHGSIVPAGHYPADDAGIRAFADAVRQTRGGLYTLLVDLVEEGFHADTLPSVRGPDRQAMLERKRSQTFFGTPLSGALSVGHDRSGRRHDERFLFVALTRPAIVDPWLQVLRTANAPLTGIHSVALLLDSLVQRLARPTERCLLVTLAPGGMRQTFIDHGHLRFSRLAPGLTEINADTAARCAGEILKTHSYLTGQRMLPRTGRLPIYLLCNAADYAQLAPALADTDDRSHHHVDLGDMADKIGLHAPPTGSTALPMLLHWMVRESGQLQLAPAPERRLFRLWQARQAIIGTGVALCAAALLFAAKLWFDADALDQQTQQLRVQNVALQAHLAQLQAELPPLPAPLADLRGALDTLATLQHNDPTPGPWLSHLSHALDAHPELTLEAIQWQAGAQSPGNGNEARAEGRAQLSLPPPMLAERRAMIATADSFLADLARPPGKAARVTRMPVELASDKAFRSTTTGAAPAAPPRLEVSYAVEGAR
ncbi:MAG: hypothetical protein DWQ11_13225 [Proteobacteria bacterium]|nr:MAG: hypothetical protein DWQ11_13225 [Pseudomonadota bacterium]